VAAPPPPVAGGDAFRPDGEADAPPTEISPTAAGTFANRGGEADELLLLAAAVAPLLVAVGLIPLVLRRRDPAAREACRERIRIPLGSGGLDGSIGPPPPAAERLPAIHGAAGDGPEGDADELSPKQPPPALVAPSRNAAGTARPGGGRDRCRDSTGRAGSALVSSRAHRRHATVRRW
jgi:hypothetical protein